MVLDVDLQCSKCYKKVKKLLCKFPEIRDQEYDEKANKVTIKVMCCSPEKIRDKLRCKGGRSIKSIEIKKPPEKKEKEQKKPPEKKEEKQEKSPEGSEKNPKEKEKPPAEGKPSLPTLQVTLPLGFCWDPYGYCGRPVCDCWGWGCYRCGCVNYCTEENQILCTIM
ncbi:hypothetical protein SLA2020_001680 [Shorea laevis]